MKTTDQEIDRFIDFWIDLEVNRPNSKKDLLKLIESARKEAVGASEKPQSGNKPNLKQVANLSDEQKQVLDRLYAGTLKCPVAGCYEKDPVRYINSTVLQQHTRNSHEGIV